MKDNAIFYFSGTGNSLQVAKDLADSLGNAEVINMAKFNTDSEIDSKRIGIVFPVYCWGPPLIVNNFADKIRVSKNTYIFLIATYGGFPGTALEILAEHFNKREISINSAHNIFMPGNCIRSYGAFDNTKQQRCFVKEKIAVGKIVKEIELYSTNIKAAKINLIGSAIFKKTYYSMMKDCYSSDQYYSVGDSCNSCGICESVCPVQNITIDTGKPVWHHKCESCMACIQRCPQEAINYKDKTQRRKRYVNPNV